MKYLPVVLVIFCFGRDVFAQQVPRDLYMPLEFQNAYQKGTRKADGTVSSTYWQNRSTYQIKATIDPHRKVLTGEATIVYFNNGPDTLRRPTFHTYHDYYKADSKKSGFFGETNKAPVTSGVIIEKLVVNGEAVDVTNKEQVVYRGTNYTLLLKKPLLPNSSMELKINWHYTIPGKGFERSGAIDSTSMFIAYWYPEMAVLDDINGWDRILYDAATEFYHDYSDYEIEIEAPDNFILWASVAPSNETEVYTQTVRDRIAKAKKSTEPVSIFGASDFRKKAGKSIKWKYTAKNFPDFSFALSDHFAWDGALYKDSNGEFFTSAAYPLNHPEFASVVKGIGESIRIFHNDFPAYPFPYKYFTIFNGLQGGGMEFPGMANDAEITGKQMEEWTGRKTSDYEANLGLSLHEMTHMYFPFLMGNHEKKYGWMDEGMADFAGFFLGHQGESGFDKSYLGSQSVVPVMVPSHVLETSGINSYTVGSYSYHALYNLLGKDLFKKCLHAYMNSWKYKHPTPYDFMFGFNTVSGQNLNWFWKKWYFDWGYMDLGIKEFKDRVAVIENLGGRPMAFDLRFTFSDGTSVTEPVSPVVWKDASEYKHAVRNTKTVTKIEIRIPDGDAVKGNNVWGK